MTITANKQLVQDFIDDVFCGGNHEAIPQYFRPNTFWAGTIAGLLGTYRQALPDITWIVDDLIAERDKVVAQLTFQATFTGDGLRHALTGDPIEPTGNRVQMGCVWIFKIKEGKIAGGDMVIDRLMLFQQLGILSQMLAALAQQAS